MNTKLNTVVISLVEVAEICAEKSLKNRGAIEVFRGERDKRGEVPSCPSACRESEGKLLVIDSLTRLDENNHS